jgi:cation transport ATPase
LSNNTLAERQGTLDTEQHTPAAAEHPSVETVVLPIRGMTCAACQAHVERSLREAPGVLDATVNLLAHSARVMYAPAQSSRVVRKRRTTKTVKRLHLHRAACSPWHSSPSRPAPR